MRDLKAASVQFEHADGDKKNNLETIQSFLEKAAKEEVEIICFPECCVTGYWFLRKLSRDELTALAEPAPDGPTCEALIKWSRQYGITIGAGLVEIADDGRLFNTYAVAMPNGEVRRHRKLHCFISEHLESGDEYTVFDTPHDCRVGVLICYDNNIFENVRMTAMMGADVLLAPHQTGGFRSASPHCGVTPIDPALWERRRENPAAIEAEFRGPKGREWIMRWLPCHAHDNGLFVLFSNGVGRDDNEIRTGNACILDPYGQILKETWQADNVMVTATLEARLLDNCTGRRWITTRRPELYSLLSEKTGREKNTRESRMVTEQNQT